MMTKKEKLQKLLDDTEKNAVKQQPLWSIIYDDLDRIISIHEHGVTYARMAEELDVSTRTFSAALSKARDRKLQDQKLQNKQEIILETTQEELEND